MSHAETLRRILERRAATIIPGAFNALSARVIEEQGFEAVFVTGAGLSNAYLGVPDIGLLTMTEVTENLLGIRDAVNLPLFVDADTGYGNAVNMIRTVKTYERFGADALQIEDQNFPKKCGHFSGKGVVPIAEARARIRAAVDARDKLLIVARTDVLASEGINSAIDRANAFLEEGADAIFVEAPRSREQLQAIAAGVDAPLVANMVIGGATPILPRDELADLGYSLCLYANAALQSAVLGMEAALQHLHFAGSITESDGLTCSFDARQVLVRKAMFDDLEARYSA